MNLREKKIRFFFLKMNFKKFQISHSHHDMLQMHNLWLGLLVGQTCERSYRTFQLDRIFAEFSIVDTN